MKNLNYLPFLLLLISSCSANEKVAVHVPKPAVFVDTIPAFNPVYDTCFTNHYHDTIINKARYLDSLYYQSTIHPTLIKEFKKQFFDELPSNFKYFMLLFDYSDTNNCPSPLYRNCHLKLSRFCFINDYMSDSLFVKKIMDISLNGKWDSDANSELQEILISSSKKDIQLFLNLLSLKKYDEIRSIWFFYFDGPHPDTSGANMFYPFEKKYPREIKILKKIVKEFDDLDDDH